VGLPDPCLLLTCTRRQPLVEHGDGARDEKKAETTGEKSCHPRRAATSPDEVSSFMKWWWDHSPEHVRGRETLRKGGRDHEKMRLQDRETARPGHDETARPGHDETARPGDGDLAGSRDRETTRPRTAGPLAREDEAERGRDSRLVVLEALLRKRTDQ